MKLTFLLGRAGTGKTHYSLQAMRTGLLQHADGPPLIFLTPEQGTFQMERALLAHMDVKATHRAQVLSFQRLAARVLQETGGGARPLLGELGKRMVLRAIIQDHASELKLFRRAAGQPGFVDKLAQTLTELRQYRCSPDMLAAQAEKADDDEPVLGAKLHDLSIVYSAFAAYVEDEFTDPDDVLNIVAENIAMSEQLRGATVWVDGFAGFTPQEFAVLRGLWRVADHMYCALCIDPRAVGAEPTATAQQTMDGDLFAPTRETYFRLLDMAREDRVSVARPIVFDGRRPPRFASAPQLSHLEKYLFRRPGKPFSGADAGDANEVRIVAAPGARAEVEAAAREIVRVCRDKGWRYRDVAVIVRDLTPYEDLVAAVFQHYGIPHFIDSRRDLSHHPLTELVRSVMEAYAGGWHTEAVVRCLKTDFFPVERTDVDLLENYALEHGIDGAGWLTRRPWRYVRHFTIAPEAQRPSRAQEEQLRTIHDIREKAVAPLRRLRDAFKNAQTVRDVATGLWNLFEELDVARTLERWMDAAEAAGRPEEVQEHTRAWDGVLQLLDELVGALGDARLPAAAVRQVVEAGLETLRVGMIPPALDQVVVGSVDRSRQPDIRAAFVLGAGDGKFPPAPTEDLIFTDGERERLAERQLELSPPSRHVLLREQYLLYVSLTRASNYLWISYPTMDGQGREQAPAPIVQRVKQLLPTVKAETESMEPTKDEALLGRVHDTDELLATVALRLRRHRAGQRAGPVWWRLYERIAADASLRKKARPLFAALDYNNVVPPLPAETTQALYGNPLHGSVSRLESFAACPFQHFARYGLRLRERERWTLDAAGRGSFVHAALKLFVDRLDETGRDWGDLNDDDALELADNCVDELVPRLANEILLSSARHEYLAEVLRHTVRRAVWALTEHARRSDFRPYAAELSFGRGAKLPAYVVPLDDDVELHLSGQIDRIDIAAGEDALWVRLIDYKSSAHNVDIAAVAHGISLQLPLYLAVVLRGAAGEPIVDDGQAVAPARPAAIVYFPAMDPVLGENEPLSPADMEVRVRRKLRMKGLFIDDVDVVRMMDENIAGTSDLVAAEVTQRGVLARRTNAASLDGFELLMDYAEEQARRLGQRIVAGEAAVAPYRFRDAVPCRFCPFRSVCRFDPLVPGNAYRELPTMGRPVAWEHMETARDEADEAGTKEVRQ